MRNSCPSFVALALLFLLSATGPAHAVGTVSGDVTDATGDPVIGAFVALSLPNAYVNHWAYTDAAGAYTIANVPDGSYQVRASVAGRLGQYYGGVAFESQSPPSINVTDGNTTSGIDIVLPDGFFISGTVSDRDTAQPVANAYLDAFRKQGESLWWSPYAYSGAGGQYQIRGLPAGPISLYIQADGYIDTYYNDRDVYNDADTLVLDGVSSITGLDIALRPGGTLLAAVMDANGLPPHSPGTNTLLDDHYLDIQSDAAGDLWFATGMGVMGIVSGATRAWHPYNSDLPAERVSALAAGVSGARYYATPAGFVRHNPDDSMNVYNRHNSLLYSDHCTAVAAEIGGFTYIASNEGTLFKWNGAAAFTDYDAVVRGEPNATPITGLAWRANVNRLYIGTGNGLTIYDIAGNTFSRLTSAGGLPSNNVLCVAAAPDGTLWVGTDAGVYTIAPGGATATYTTTDGLPSNSITDLHVLNANRAWAATTGGLALYNAGSITAYTTAQGLGSNSRTAVLESGGVVYTGSQYSGLAILDGPAFRNLTRNAMYFNVALRNIGTGRTYAQSAYHIPLSFSGLPTGDYLLYTNQFVFPRRYYDGVYDEPLATAIAVTAGATTAQRHALVVEEFGGIAGAARQANGDPLASGTVTFIRAGDLSSTVTTPVVGGAYSSTSLAPGDYYVALYRNPDPVVLYPGVFALHDAAIVSVSPGITTSGIDLQLKAATPASLAGRILDADGNPYPHVRVTIRGQLGASTTTFVNADARGEYQASLPPGNYTVSALPFGLPSVYHASTFESGAADIVGVDSGEAVMGIDVVVPDFPPATVFGVVVDEGGAPVAGAAIEMYAERTLPTVLSAADGSYEFTGLPPQTGYHLAAAKDGYFRSAKGPLKVAAGAVIGPVTLTLQSFAPAPLSGTIRDASGNSLWSTYVVARHLDSGHSDYTYTGWEGAYAFPEFPQGSVRVEASYSGFESAARDLPLTAAGAVADVTLPWMNTRAALWGRALDSSGKPRPGLQIRLTGPATNYYTTNADGVFIAPNLNAGVYNVEGWSFSDNDTPVNGLNLALGDVLGPIDIAHDLPFATVTGEVRRRTGGASIPFPDVYRSGPFNPTYAYSDASGRYALCGLRPGSYVFYADTSGFVLQYYNDSASVKDAAPVALLGSEDVDGIDFLLDPGASVSGRVVDAYGRGMEGANVYVQDTVTGSQRYAGVDLHGHYTVHGIAPGLHNIRAFRSLYYTRYYDGKTSAATADPVPVTANAAITGIDLQIGVGGSLSGAVVDASGAPYSSGTVYAYDAADLTDSLTSSSINSSGEYTLDRLPPGAYYLRASVSGRPSVFYPSAYSAARATLVSASEASLTTGLDIVIPQTAANGAISGVIRRENGEPYGSLAVRANGVDGYSGSYSANTNAAGEYLIANVNPGSYAVSIQEANTPRYYHGGSYNLAAAIRVEVTPGAEVTGIDIQAPPKSYATVSGTVRTGPGVPIPGVAVAVESNFSSHVTVTNAAGAYSLSGVFPDPDYTLTARKAGYYRYEHGPLAVAAAASVIHPVTLTAYDACLAYGKVLNASGAPLRDTYVSIAGITVDYDDYQYSDNFGDYLFSNLPPGVYSLSASRYPYAEVSVSGINLSPASPVRTDLILPDQANRGVISGTVTDAGGRPVRGVQVRATGPLTATEHTLADGTYQIRSLTPGAYTVSLNQEADSGYPSQPNVMVAAGDETMNIDFALSVHYGTFSGRIQDATGGALHATRISVTPANHNYYPASVHSGTQGIYIVERVRSDGSRRYRLYAEKAHYVTTYYDGALDSNLAEEIEMAAGEDRAGLDVTLPDGGGFSGAVRDAQSGNPVAGTVYSSGAYSTYASVNASGFYEFTTLPAGNYTLRFAANGYAQEYYDNVSYLDEARTLTLGVAERRDDIDFSPSREARISGFITDASGAPLAGYAYAYQARRTSNDAFSNYTATGAYTLSGLPSGNYYVYASVSGKPILYYNQAYGRQDATQVPAPVGKETTGIDLILPVSAENGSLSGRITRPGGFPYHSVRVYYHGVDGTSGSGSTTTDSNGEYLFTNRTAGSYLVSVRETNLPDYYYNGTWDRGSARRIVLEPGANTGGINIQTVTPPTARLEGTVRDTLAQPLAGVEIELNASPVIYRTTTRSDGSYALPDVFPQGGYLLTATRGGYFPYRLDGLSIPAGETTLLDITLAGFAPALAGGKVTNASGSPIPDAYIELTGRDVDFNAGVYTDVFGDYVIRDIPPGSYRIACSAYGYLSETRSPVTANPATPAVNHFVLDFDPAYGVVAGRVTDKHGNPVFRVQVRSNNFVTVYTDRNGQYQMPRLSAGVYSLSLPQETDSGTPVIEGVTVSAGQITDGVDFVLSVAYGTISGRITTKTGDPLHRADVYGTAVNSSPSPSGVVSATSGLYVLARVRSDGGRDYTVRAGLSGYAETYYPAVFTSAAATVLRLNEGASLTGIDIALPPGAGFAGRLTDAHSGLPVASGTIYASGDRTFTATPDSAGLYRFNSLPPGNYTLYFQGTGYVREYFRESPWSQFALSLALTEGQVRTGFDFTPEREATVSGTVTDASGIPYTSGSVYAYSIAQGYDVSFSSSLNSTGQYTISGVPSGSYVVAARVSGRPAIYHPSTYDAHAAAVIAVTSTHVLTGIDIVVPQDTSPGTLAGRVRRPDGTAYSSLSVRAYGLDANTNTYFASTNSAGEYALTGILPGLYAVAAVESNTAPWYRPGTYDRLGADRLLVLPGAALTGIDLTTPPPNPALLAGVVRDPQGRPLSGATIALESAWSNYSDTSSPDGSFRFPTVFAADDYTLRGSKAGYSTASQSLAAAPGEVRADFVLVLTPFAAGGLAGIVTDASGRAIESAYLYLRKADGSFEAWLYSDSLGEYTFPSVPQGNYTLDVSRTGYNSRQYAGLAVPAGSATRRDVVLTPISSRGRVAGTVLDASGNPVYRVRVLSEGPTSQTAYTDEDGDYVLPYLSAGTYRIHLPDEPSPGNERLAIVVAEGQDTLGVDFSLSIAYGAIAGTVRDVTGTPLHGLTVQTRRFDGTGGTVTAKTGLDGRYLIGRLPLDGNSYRVWCAEPPYAPVYWNNAALFGGAAPVLFDASNRAGAIDFTLRKGASITGRVVSTTQIPLGNVYVSAQLQRDTNPSFVAYTNNSGWYAAAGLTSGTYTLYFSASGYFTEYYDDERSSANARRFFVGAGSDLRIDAELKAVSSLSGTVRSATGAPLSGVLVSLRNLQNTYSANRTTDTAGLYAFTSLDNGNYILRASKSGYPTVYYDGRSAEADADVFALLVGRHETVDMVLLPFCPADFDQDGDVDIDDVVRFHALMQSQGVLADLNGDGVVDYLDVMDFAQRWSP